jgi:hypothetical protein
MIEKIIILDENMRMLYSFKLGLLEHPNIISSMFFLGKTLLYSLGNNIYYFYGDDDINQKVFSCDFINPVISGVMSDRYILTNKTEGNNNNIIVNLIYLIFI